MKTPRGDGARRDERAASPSKGRRRFDGDRVIALRVLLAVVVVLFLYLILQVSMIAFGGSARREMKRIERAVDAPSMREPTASEGAGSVPAPAR